MLSLSIVITGCSNASSGSDDVVVKIEFFHYKREAIDTFDKLIKKFESENPNIKVEQVSPPEAEVVLKTRVAKNDIPDIIGIGANNNYKELSKAGVFVDLSKDKNLELVQPAYLQMLKNVSGLNEIYAIPFAANADAVIYNKKIFSELGLQVPKTWDEFIQVAEKVKAAGKIPFYFTLKDAWTTLPVFNVLAANTQGDDFYTELNKGKILAGERYKEAAEKFVQLLNYGHKDQQGVGYNDGNTAFANGKAAMYLQGIWAIPEIKKANPNIDLGVFPYPVSNTPNSSKVVSGVDLQFSLAASSKHPEEARKFIEFLLKEENAKQYITEQNAFSTLKGIVQEDPVLAGLKSSFDKGAVVDFPDHYIPVGVSVDKALQTLAQTKDVNKFLNTIQTDWEKVENRK
ncbi:ABC transporter substrate-binding protein [Tepidibacillus decaturensis]|uniref:ABC transporter substrate-binding protein n=2 Tax=Tepidibacillus decaturensis TaxID=1413211 RepID=A0A135L7U9_9BACI|nr:ABC transporter substrate-binding protein [Tepidibacillus decaturensis]